ncbi:MAG: phosphoadenosine phosphosulfate reductase family protein [Comamonadaceae bacterium]|nr:phosphoadenosine phosphosulfate reductase family protein [Comamonadaceae bacterium]
MGIDLHRLHQPGRRSRRASTRSRTARQIHTDVMKTQALKQALDQHGFDAAFGGARRDEEKSRAKERIFSFRDGAAPLGPEEPAPRALAPLQRAASTRASRIRVFPMSNWTELDIWQYIYLREHPDRAAVLRGRAPGGRARRHADHGGRRPHAAAARREADAEEGALPHARLLPADRRGRERGRHAARRSSRRCCSTHQSERQGRVIDHDAVGVDGEEEAGGVLLMAHVSDLIASDIEALPRTRTSTRACCASSPAAASTTARAR